MPIKIAAAQDHPNYSVHIAITGTTAGKTYVLWRTETSGPGLNKYTSVWSGVPPTGGVDDPIAPLNTPLRYLLTEDRPGLDATTIPGAALATADTVLDFTGPNAGTGPQAPVIPTGVGDFPLLRAPLHPELGFFKTAVLVYEGDFMLRATVYEIIGSPAPVVSGDVMQLKSGSLQWTTNNNGERAQLIELLRNTGIVLHLRAPCIDGAADNLFFVPLEVTESIPEPSRPDFRVWTVAFQQVNKPWQVILPAGTQRLAWGEVKTDNPTWAAVKAHYSSWLVLRYNGGLRTFHSNTTPDEGSV